MRRTVTILTTFLVLWTSAVYAVNPNETSATQGLYENENGPGGNNPGRLPAIKGPDISPAMIQEDKNIQQDQMVPYISKANTIVFDENEIQQLLSKHQNKENLTEQEWEQLNAYWAQQLPPRRPDSQSRNNNRAALSEGFEGATFPPGTWQAISNNTSNSVIQSSAQAHEGVYSARFSSYNSASDYNQYLITPKLTVATGDSITFWHSKHYSFASDQITVGISTTDSSIASFTFGSALTSTTAWARHAEDLSAYVGQEIYVAINYWGAYQYYLYVDNFNGPNAEGYESPDLFFSEWIEGASYNKALELYNPTADTIWLDNYAFPNVSNAPTTPGEYEFWNTFDAGAYVLPGEVFVLAHPSADAAMLQAANMTSFSYFSNGDDGFGLVKGGVWVDADADGSVDAGEMTGFTVLDWIGDWEGDPGSGWDVAGVSAATANHTILRDAGTLWGNTDWTAAAGDASESEWNVYDQDYFANLGGYPDDPCYDSLTTVTVVALSYGSEKHFMVQNASGDTLLSCFGCMGSNTTFTEDICLTDGLYSFFAKDGYGDGWDGATFTITNEAGNVLAAGTGPTSADGTSWIEYPFSIGVMLPIVSGLSDLDFAGNIIGAAAEESMQIINTGLGDFEVTGITVAGDAFASTTTALTVVPGDTGYINLTYTPTAEGGDAGSVEITHNASSDGSAVTDTFALSGFGVDAIFYEDFGPFTGNRLVLPMSGWTILDNNGDATTIPAYRYTWYHDQFGLDHNTGLYTYGNGAMTAYIGSGNSYHANETMITPQINVSTPSKVTFWMYNNYDRGYEFEVSYSTDGITYTALGSYPITNVYTQHSAILPDTGNQYIAFTFAPDSGGLYTYFNFDEVAISALPNTQVSGLVLDYAEATPLAGAEVEFGGATDVSDSDGHYNVYGAEPGRYPITVSADGYLDSYFSLDIDIGDSLIQNFYLVNIDSAAQVVYHSGFESGDDMGWTYTGGTNPFELSAGFTFYEDYYTNDTMTVAPFAGDSMMVCSPTGYTNSEFSWWMNLTDTNMDLSGYSSAEITLQMNYATEAGFDFIILLATWPEVYGGTYYYLDVNGDGIGDANDRISGSSDGWAEIEADLSGWTGTNYGVEVAVLLTADATVDLGFGVAIDDVVVNGFTNPRPWVADLAAESFVNDQIHLMWSDPTGGQRTMASNTITMNRTPVEIDPRNPRKAFEYEISEEEITINIPEGNSRDLVSYDIYRTDQYYFTDYSGFDFIANIAIDSYTDTNVVNHSLYYYYVTAVYDEGESLGSLWAAAGAGEVTDVAMADVAIDFEDSTLGNWEVLTFTDNGWEVGETNTGFYGVPTHPDGGFYAFVNDDAAGSAATSESRLVSPFFNMGDADHAAITFDYFNGHGSQTLNVWAWIGWDTWISLGELPANSASGWQTVSVDLSSLAGLDHVRLYAWFTDNGGWYGSVAMDNISVSTFDGPTALTLTETTESVTLHWTGLGGRAAGSRVNEYPDGVSEAEKLLASDLYDIRNPGQIGQHGEDNFSRVQGDSIGNPFVIDSLPFSITGSTVGFTDDYNEVCPYTTSGADVVYQVTLGTLVNPLVVDLCESYYDTKVYMYSASDTTNPIACSDDFCTASHGQAWTSYMEISPALLPPGDYYIVVDGYSAADSGDYVLEVYESNPPPPPMDVMYNVYRDGSLIAGGLADSVTSFLDVGATLLEACYVVTASVRTLGLDGDTLAYVETGYSNEACGSVVNQPPGDFTLLTPSDGDTIMITGDNISSSQIFAWTASVDPNGTPIEYEQCVSILSPFDQFCEDAGSSTAEFVPLTDFADYIDSLMQAGLSNGSIDINWTVYASDGMDDTEASNGPRTLHIDAGWALGVNDELGIPDVFALHQNYPNPFNPVTSIRFDVPEESRVLLDIYNVTGQKVATLVNGNMQPGFHSIRWNGTNEKGKQLASGMYFYRISSSKFTEVKKLILMK